MMPEQRERHRDSVAGDDNPIAKRQDEEQYAKRRSSRLLRRMLRTVNAMPSIAKTTVTKPGNSRCSTFGPGLASHETSGK
jgi:hypothetical protein